MLSFNEFKEAVYKELRKEFGEKTNLVFKTVDKLNGTSYEGMGIDMGVSGIRPMLSIEKYYYIYQFQPMALNELMESIKNMVKNIPEEICRLTEEIKGGKTPKNRIFMRVINNDKNRGWLEEAPHKKVLDLALTFYIGAGGRCRNDYVINLNNRMMEDMGLGIEELEELARENMSTYQKPVIKNIDEIISEPGVDLSSTGYNEDEDMDGMFVLTNEADKLGAVCMFYEQVLEGWAERLHDDIYILPSSIHETLLISRKGKKNWELLRQMVQDMNKNFIEGNEILSDEIYIFERAAGKVTFADKSLEERE